MCMRVVTEYPSTIENNARPRIYRNGNEKAVLEEMPVCVERLVYLMLCRSSMSKRCYGAARAVKIDHRFSLSLSGVVLVEDTLEHLKHNQLSRLPTTWNRTASVLRPFRGKGRTLLTVRVPPYYEWNIYEFSLRPEKAGPGVRSGVILTPVVPG